MSVCSRASAPSTSRCSTSRCSVWSRSRAPGARRSERWSPSRSCADGIDGGGWEMGNISRGAGGVERRGKNSDAGRDARDVEGAVGESVIEFVRKGDGWGEELFPTVRVVRRVVEERGPGREGLKGNEVTTFLTVDLGMTEEDAQQSLVGAASWRITSKGRALLDKKKMALIRTSMRPAVAFMRETGGLSGAQIRRAIVRFPLSLQCDASGQKDLWGPRLLLLVCYYERHGSYCVPEDGAFGGDEGFVRWIRDQLQRYREGYTTQRELALLNGVGWQELLDQWMPTTWEDRFDELLEWKLLEPEATAEPNGETEAWLREQGQRHALGVLPPLLQRRLKSIGVDLNKYARRLEVPYAARLVGVSEEWMRCYVQARKFRAKYGHCMIPLRYPRLAKWVATERKRWRRSELPPNKERLLRESKIRRENYGEIWAARLSQLKQFKKRHGHCAVPKSSASLYRWLTRMKAMARDGTLPEDRALRLDEMGVSLSATISDELWQRRMSELRKFASEKGHANVPKHRDDGLGMWLKRQRLRRARGILSEGRLEELEELGIVWDPRKERWDGRFEQLRDFQRREGHCNVPQRWQENPALGRWVTRQMYYYQQGTLSEERFGALESIGFFDRLMDASEK